MPGSASPCPVADRRSGRRPGRRRPAGHARSPHRAHADAQSDDPCDLIAAPPRTTAKTATSGGGAAPLRPRPHRRPRPPRLPRQGCADAAAWTVDKLSKAVKATANVDFTNPTFLRQYAVVFAASTILTLVLWLLAVAKRAIRGVPLTTAISEADRLPLADRPRLRLHPADPLHRRLRDRRRHRGHRRRHRRPDGQFFGTFSEALKKGNDIGGGPIMLIVVSLVIDPRRRRALPGARHPRRPALRRRAARRRRLRRASSTRTCGATSAAGRAS